MGEKCWGGLPHRAPRAHDSPAESETTMTLFRRQNARSVVFIGLLATALTACSGSTGTAAPSTAVSSAAASPSASVGAVASAPAWFAIIKTVATGTKLKIWYINILTSYPQWQWSMDKFSSEAAAGNYEPTAIGVSQLDLQKNVSQAEQAIAEGADGIIICDADPKTWATTIKKAQDAGVVVVTIGCVDDISSYSVGTDNTKYGQVAADQVATDVGKNAQVGIIMTDASTPNQVMQLNSFNDYIATKYPDMKVVAVEYDNSQQSTAATKITAMVAANPTMNALICLEGLCPAASATGLAEAGKKPGDIYVLGIDAPDATKKAMQDGWVNSILDQCWFSSTQFVTGLIRAAKEGNPVAQQSWPVTLWPVSKDEISTYTGCPASALPQLP